MPSNSADSFRKLNEEYEDGLFRLIMNAVAEKEGKQYLEENEQLKKDPEYMPSKESIERFTELLDFHLKKAKKKSKKHHFTKVLNRAAVAILAIVIIFTTAVVTVEAFRVQVFNFLISIESKYTSYQLSDAGDNKQNTGGLGLNWTNAYAPTYIPEGFEVTSVSSVDPKRIIFTNKKDSDLSVVYCEYNSSNSVQVDTENASTIEKIKINGHDGTLSFKNNIVSIAWVMNDHLFTVQGQLSTDEAIKLADSVKFIN